MSLFDLLLPRAESLSLTSTRGWSTILDSWGLPMTTSGTRISHHKASTLSAYYAAIIIVASDMAKIPLRPFTRLPNGGRDADPSHAAHELLMVQANPLTTAVNFREDLVATYLGWGHGYAKISRNLRGEPVMLEVLHPPNVRPRVDEDGYFFEHTHCAGTPEIIRDEDMVHLRGPLGWSVARQGAEVLGIARAEQDYSASYLAHASVPSGILESDGELPEDTRLAMQKSWQEMYGGGKNRGKVALMTWGVKYKQLAVNPADAQLLDSRRFSLEEIARMFRISPQKLMDRTRAQGWSTLEITDAEHVGDGLLPHMVRLEAELNRKLMTQAERNAGSFFQHVVNALLRGDSKSRAAFYAIMFRLGVLAPNEMRAFENLNPIGPEGDTHFVSQGMVSLKLAAEGGHLKTQGGGASSSSSSPGRGGPGGTPEDGAAVRNVFVAAAERMTRMQMNAALRLAKTHEGNFPGFSEALGEQTAKMASRVDGFFTPAAGLLGVAEPSLGVLCKTLMQEGALDIEQAFKGEGVEAEAEALEATIVKRTVDNVISRVAASAAAAEAKAA